MLVNTIYKAFMRQLSKHEKELWAKVCATVDNRKPRRGLSLPSNAMIRLSTCLDLHGHTEDSAYSSLSQMMASNYFSSNRQVTVITGKGKGGVGILRRLVPYWLDTTLSTYVRSYYFDPKNTGQLIINLKK